MLSFSSRRISVSNDYCNRKYKMKNIKYTNNNIIINSPKNLLNLLLTNKQKDNIIVNVNKQNQHMRY